MAQLQLLDAEGGRVVQEITRQNNNLGFPIRADIQTFFPQEGYVIDEYTYGRGLRLLEYSRRDALQGATLSRSRLEYDQAGRLASRKAFLGDTRTPATIETYTYSPSGRPFEKITQFVDSHTETTLLSWKKGAVHQIEYDNGQGARSLSVIEYDSIGRIQMVETVVIEGEFPGGRTEFDYNELGWLVARTQFENDQLSSVESYSYGADGHLGGYSIIDGTGLPVRTTTLSRECR
jgi:hypothetical protein